MTAQPTLDDADAVIERALERCIGLDASTIGRAAVQRAARSRMAAVGIDSPAAYAARIEADERERDALVEEVVVAESWFFRDPQVFEFVARFATTLAALPGRTPVRILSAPCAAGEEPYSIAMALLDAGLDPARFVIEAVDVSRVALERAARGRYSANAFRNADLSFRERWFRPGDGGSLVDERVRSQVRFAAANVLDPAFRAGREPYDIVFCRNLLIYLGADARRRLAATLDTLLRPDGVLVLGAAEPPILRGDWIPAGSASVFALRRGVHAAPPPAPAAPAGRRRAAGATRPAAPPAIPEAERPSAEGLVDVLERAGQLANHHRHADALAVCEEARSRLAPSPELFYLMGMLHQAVGDLDRAEGCFHKTVYLDAAHDEALLALALLAAQRGDARMAETYRASAARASTRKEAT